MSVRICSVLFSQPEDIMSGKLDFIEYLLIVYYSEMTMFQSKPFCECSLFFRVKVYIYFYILADYKALISY